MAALKGRVVDISERMGAKEERAFLSCVRTLTGQLLP